jgi:acyl dehydratase
MKIYQSLADWEGALGTHVGYSDWRPVTQHEVDLFAEATGDHQWIHVDPIRAKDGPFGGTIAHGYLTLSLIPQLVWEIFKVEGVEASLNYGPNRVRFPAPLPVGSRIRAGVELISLEPTGAGIRETMRVTVERLGGDKPVCVAETVNILIPANGRAGG